MIVRNFRNDDLMHIALQPQQRSIARECATPEYAAELAKSGPVYTAQLSCGEVIACAGLVEQWPGCLRAYAFLGENAGRSMIALTRGVKKFLADNPARRVEAAVECTFTEGIRWVNMLGFHYEGHMRAYWNGRDAYLFARVK